MSKLTRRETAALERYERHLAIDAQREAETARRTGKTDKYISMTVCAANHEHDANYWKMVASMI